MGEAGLYPSDMDDPGPVPKKDDDPAPRKSSPAETGLSTISGRNLAGAAAPGGRAKLVLSGDGEAYSVVPRYSDRCGFPR